MFKVSSELAILGGKPILNTDYPHFVWPIVGEDEINAVVNQLKASPLSYYRSDGIIEEFEKTFASYHNVSFAISTCSGTAAIHAAFFCLNLPVGSEVIAPAYTHLSTIFPMLHVGLIPILCDIEEETGNIDVELIESKISKDTKAIIVTHQYGHICDMDRINGIAKKHSLFVIEDCSHAHGATFHHKLAGTFGDIACFSLQSHKSVWGGEGGVMITNRPELADRASLFAHFRQTRPYTAPEHALLVESGYGLKNRLHPLAATLAQIQFKKLPLTIKRRAENYNYFLKSVEGIKGIRCLIDRKGVSRGGFFRFVFKYLSEELEGLPIEIYLEALQAEGVSSVVPGALAKPINHFNFFHHNESGFYPMFFQSFFEEKSNKLIYQIGDFPKAEYFSANTLQFPAFTLPSKHIIKKYAQAMYKIQINIDKLKNRDKQ